MRQLGNFFIFCSGIDRTILAQSPTEYNKYAGIGATVFFTGVFAMVASNYALYTVFNNIWISSGFGLLWGMLIFNLDRYIVSSLKKKGYFFRDFGLALPRIVLAVIISIVISKPLELKIFETEINAEIISMQQEKRKEHEDLLKSRYQNDIDKLDTEILAINEKMGGLRANKDNLKLDALGEADGTGGSKIRNMGPIYKAKMAAAAQADEDLKAKEAESAPQLAEKEARKKVILAERDADMKKMEFAALTGFASRMEALSRVTTKSHAVLIASLFLMLLFIAIETAPLFVKLISERSPYDYLLDKIEVAVEMDHKEYTTMKKMEVNNRLDLEQKTRAHKNQELITADSELFSHALKSEVEALKRGQLGLKDYLQKSRALKGEALG
jgi:hypothetical protein